MSLSPRQLDILVLSARGYTERQIAYLTNSSRYAINAHKRCIFYKLGAVSMANAISIAYCRHIITPQMIIDATDTLANR